MRKVFVQIPLFRANVQYLHPTNSSSSTAPPENKQEETFCVKTVCIMHLANRTYVSQQQTSKEFSQNECANDGPSDPRTRANIAPNTNYVNGLKFTQKGKSTTRSIPTSVEPPTDTPYTRTSQRRHVLLGLLSPLPKSPPCSPCPRKSLHL